MSRLEHQNSHPWIIVDGVDYSGKSTLSEALGKSVSGIVVRPIPTELSQVRLAVEQHCNLQERYNFYIAASFYSHHKIQGLLIQQNPVITDRWMFSTNIHHQLLGVPKDKLLPIELIPTSPFMFFTSVSYDSWVKRKLERGDHGIDDDFITAEFVKQMNEFLRDNGLVEINTNQMTPKESVQFILGYIHRFQDDLTRGTFFSTP